MTFSDILVAIKIGATVRRAGWNGKGMWLVIAKEWNGNLGVAAMPTDWRGYAPFIAMYTADKKLVPWLASQTDILADDWEIV